MQVEVCKLASCLKGPLRGIRAKGTQGWARAKQWNQRNTILAWMQNVACQNQNLILAKWAQFQILLF